MSSHDTIKQLDSARAIVLRDPAIYPQVVPGVLPVIGASQPLELRRWGADFLAETFASPVVPAEDKAKMSLAVLETLRGYLNRKDERGEEEDASVLKSAVQCAASVYPLVFRHVISEAGDKAGVTEVWGKMVGLKSAVLRRLEAAEAGVRVCCVKFVARVVQVQTPGLIADPRKPEQNEISLALVPREHPVLIASNLEAEASGLLDRLLAVFQDSSTDAIIATATLNALSALVHRRATISTKILTTILATRPPAARAPSTPVQKVLAKSLTRTTIAFLNNVLKRSASHPLLPRIQAHIDRLRQSLQDTSIDAQPTNGLKRGPDEPIDGLHPAKRHQLDSEVDTGSAPQQQQPQHAQHDGPLPPGPVSYKDLYTLVAIDPRAAGFHVEVIPQHIVAQLVPPLLQAVDHERFHIALNAVRSRILEVERRPPLAGAADVGMGGKLDVEEDEEDEYDPSALGFGEMDQSERGAVVVQQQQVLQQRAVAEAMKLPPEPPLSEQEREEYAGQVRERLFETLRELDEEGKGEKALRIGFNGVGGQETGGRDREGWITLLIRLATRSGFRVDDGHDDDDGERRVKEEGEEWSLVKQGEAGGGDLPTMIRAALNRYIMDDWRRRIDVAIAWLNEEWYADRLRHPASTQNAQHPRTTPGLTEDNETPSPDEENQAEPNPSDLPTYTPLTLTLLDQLLPYLDTKDARHLIRFLSEIPYLPPSIFTRIHTLAEDPERVHLSAQALLYLIMLRPPVREMAVECAVGIWRGNKEARGAMGKVVAKWRPEVLEEGKEEVMGEEVKVER